ncbi:3-deoxy-7-phosphoheptulonate synthase [Lactiplantibacillus mudanjiangensis]|uniref:3-deoxy-7-phosphoheptulonate synthase [Lactobacillus plantarum JDM1] n=1 Tax=Lactiplantibacillus mudanjiangensis TaxID=1296538 RepID=A0A660E1M0_9LACO|nr:3-deoxy-7-phosphoheptulonate synthase [Lactiplantibacillus mudanjiangensis]VDG17654.1 3-deoxy-7-phosphoheptulonate synthase [Lactobacillus plantarum JDM1] [Lactiplantibacillus mudanjiangensis]VDG23071.1 3-deoxy-7-phosphoheptulonate synthase [Lactobacillus plantarum JDM1] [Lactiplantibacillus mudanjiangensis]VDG29544.1 3-deoxy-7-phosphoheptulonate synthase [Lactobacillus plantarum JDM1] [Lactiplantibacillus mudanjiangensis]VDG32657.1 3-deoxy-7-phosphoheptulonate synthase [Lactobacillus planta
MIIILKETTASAMQARLVAQFGAKTEIFTHDNRIALQGVNPDELPADVLAAADEVITDVPAAVQSSRLLHPEDTIIKTPHSVIGGADLVMMAGPCSVESAEHVMAMAKVAKQGGATVVRGGAFKPRTSPYSFQGLGETGLQYLRAAADANGLDMITEVMDDEHVEMVAKYTDIFQIGARNMQNFSLLKAVGQTNIPVALKRGMSATIDDVLNAAEYIAAGGNHQIMLLERGIRTFDNKYTRNTFDLGAVPVLQQLTHYPVIVDPSHAVGEWDLVTPMAMAGVAASASGMIVEIHDDPTHALSDGPQALKPKTYLKMAKQAFQLHDLMQTWD